MSPAEEPGRPVLRLVRGDATAEEIAALLAVISAGTGGSETATKPTVTSAWTDRATLMPRPSAAGPGGWRASAWPR
jgi:hypothetical protein